jgi:beta-glucosidase
VAAVSIQRQTSRLSPSSIKQQKKSKMKRISPRRSKGSKKGMAEYKNPKLPAKRRVKDLLGRMSLEEKAAQMMCVWQEKTDKLLDTHGNFDGAKAKKAFKTGNGLGQVGRPSDAGSTEPSKGKDARGQAELTNAIQKFFIENSRLASR